MKLLGGFAILWGAFLLIPAEWKVDWFDGSESIQISIEQEEKLGDFLLDAFLEGRAVMEDPTVDSAMWVIESRLLKHIGPTDYDFTFYVVRDDMVNAMTLPGGNIVVFTGLLEFCETPEEVAAVLAHELGHVQHRHVVEKLITELGMTFVVAVLSGGDATLIHELTHTLVSGVFSRNQESEADDYGMNLMLESQIDPKAMAAFFRRLNREEMGYEEYMEWMMSHPHNNARIKASLEFPVPDGFQSKPILLDWDRVLDAV